MADETLEAVAFHTGVSDPVQHLRRLITRTTKRQEPMVVLCTAETLDAIDDKQENQQITNSVSSLIQENMVQAFPSPFNDKLNIEIGLKTTAQVEVNLYNISGQLVKNLVPLQTKSEGIGIHDFDLSFLNAGMYYYQVRIDGKVYSDKVVKI